MTLPDNNLPDPAWDLGTWDGLERDQLRRWAKIPFPQKLEWLEQAHQLALRLQTHREQRGRENPKT